MNTIILLSIIMGGSVFGATYFKKRFEETLIVTLSSIMVFLYVFYIFNALLVGFYAAVVLLIGCFVASAYKMIKDKTIKPFITSFFTPGFFVFALLVFAYFLITSNSTVILWDELRLWAAVPKALFFDPSLQLGTNSVIYENMQAYFPGMSLLNFFFLNLRKDYEEIVLFFVYAIFVGSMLLPCTKSLSFKQYWKIPIDAFILFMLPLTFYNSVYDSAYFYKTLYIDPVLGIAFAYSLFLIWKMEKVDVFNYTRYTLSLFVLILLKSSGMVFVVLSFAIFLIKERKNFKIPEFFVHKTIGIKEFLCKILKYVSPIFIVGLTYFSWKALVLIYTPKSIIEAKVFEAMPPLSDGQIATIKDFFTVLIPTAPLLRGNVQTNETYAPMVSWIGFFVMFTIVSLLICFVVKGRLKEKTIVVMMGVTVSSIIYMLGICWLFVKLFNASYQRYTNTSMLAWLALLTMIIIYLINGDKEKNKPDALVRLIIACTFAAALIFPFRLPPVQHDLREAASKSFEFEQEITNAIKVDKRTKVCLIQEIESEIDRLHNYYNLIDDNIDIISYRILIDDIEGISENEKYKQLSKMLIDNKIEYVYLRNIDAQFENCIVDIFENGKTDISPATVYKVVNNNGQAMLVKQNNI